ncbi:MULTISPECIES: hypothetical protein [unclassified Leptolyngbya]|uniref:hypothetical protein n=1 Tax=unclassified Leptolyngbya TaxID=2650499 RepID=UPI001F549EE3|nr:MULTISPECIES: hypothetical protein [unclassified Leptolyngbya]
MMNQPIAQTGAQTGDVEQPYQIQCDRLPLAIYREVVAHLRQVAGVEAGLLPQTSQKFDYLQSQVGGLWIQYTAAADQASHLRVEQILAYYGDRYGNWEVVKPTEK